MSQNIQNNQKQKNKNTLQKQGIKNLKNNAIKIGLNKLDLSQYFNNTKENKN
jgi:hypothetical protein